MVTENVKFLRHRMVSLYTVVLVKVVLDNGTENKSILGGSDVQLIDNTLIF